MIKSSDNHTAFSEVNEHERARQRIRATIAAAGFCFVAAHVELANAQQLSNAEYETQVDVVVASYAQLDFLNGHLLYLLVPPSASTVNAPSSVIFQASGNAVATITAEPDEFMLVPPRPGDDGGWMGKAVLGGEEIGYKLLLTFPSNAPFGCGCGPVKSEALPLETATGTSPLSANLALTSGVRRGAIDLYASTAWTLHGGLPVAGVYEGGILLTVTASD